MPTQKRIDIEIDVFDDLIQAIERNWEWLFSKEEILNRLERQKQIYLDLNEDE